VPLDSVEVHSGLFCSYVRNFDMPTLSLELYDRCRKIFLKCEVFESDRSLAAVFVVEGLAPLRLSLKDTSSTTDRVNLCIDMLIRRSSEHHLPLLVFSRTLREHYEPEDGLHNELTALCEDLSIALTSTLAFSDNSPLQEDNQSGRPELRKEPSLNEIYVERSELQKCCQELRHQYGSPLIRLRSPRGMGKTQLIRQVIKKLGKSWKTAFLDFNLADPSDLLDLTSLLKWVCIEVSEQLKISDETETYWNRPGSVPNATRYFENHLLSKGFTSLLLALDNVDAVFSRSRGLANDFCTLLRGWTEKTKEPGHFQKLHLIVAHSTDRYGSFDITRSPLNNIGIRISLERFQVQEIQELSRVYQVCLNHAQLQKIDDFSGGHPSLLNIAFRHLGNSKQSLVDELFDELFDTSYRENGIFVEHLERHLSELEENPALQEAFKIVISSAQSVALKRNEIFQLRSMGLVSRKGNTVAVSCALYQKFFSEIWE